MSEKLRGVLVGCGGMSLTWVRVARKIPDFELVGFVDIDLDAAKTRAADYGEMDRLEISTDLSKTLENTRPDVVFDCSIPETHAEVTLEALGAGCHVLGEKPLADSMENARQVVKAAEEAGKVYAVMQNRRFDANIRRLRRVIESGEIGALTTLNSDFYKGRHFGGFRDIMPHVLLLDMAIHTFDAARLILGADPVSVYCKEWNPPGSWFKQDASAVAIFEMDNGIVYTYRGSWCSEGLETTWECDWRVIGDQGSILWDGADGFNGQAGVVGSKYRDLEVEPASAADKQDGHEGLIRDFVRCIRNGETPETVGSDNIKSLAMVFGAIVSAAKKEPVPVEC